MNRKYIKGFTLVELLTVVAILGMLFLFVTPKLSSLIKNGGKTEKEILEVKVIDAAKEYADENVNFYNSFVNIGDENYVNLQDLIDKGLVDKEDVEKLDEFSRIKGVLDENDSIKFTIEYTNLNGELSGYTLASTYFNSLCNNASGCTDSTETNGLVKTNGTEIRYRGENPNNYVTFNDEVAGWRIIGIFDGRVKLIRNDSLGNFSWDTAPRTISSENDDGYFSFGLSDGPLGANGFELNQWGESGTYKGADLMRELNGDYLNTSLTENQYWFNGDDDEKTGVFNKDNVLKSTAQSLIGNATWYLGGGTIAYKSTTEEEYNAERSNNTCNESGFIGCKQYPSNDDKVVRTTTWTGKVGLMYPSDYAYASGKIGCLIDVDCYNLNWMPSGWTITPNPSGYDTVFSILEDPSGPLGYNFVKFDSYALQPVMVHPSVYLVSDVKVKGDGTISNPFVFAK